MAERFRTRDQSALDFVHGIKSRGIPIEQLISDAVTTSAEYTDQQVLVTNNALSALNQSISAARNKRWYNALPNRTYTTYYSNAESEPISVSISFTGVSQAQLVITPNENNAGLEIIVGRVSVSGTSESHIHTLYADVPPGHFYQLRMYGGSTLVSWSERRLLDPLGGD